MVNEFGLSFLVVESDPLVREDIAEALAAAFGDCSIVSAGAADDLPASQERYSAVILSAMGPDASQAVASVVSHSPGSGLVFVGTKRPAVTKIAPHAVFIQKPFSADALVAAVRSVLSVPQSCQ